MTDEIMNDEKVQTAQQGCEESSATAFEKQAPNDNDKQNATAELAENDVSAAANESLNVYCANNDITTDGQTASQTAGDASYFTGKMPDWLWRNIKNTLLNAITFGIAAPWIRCRQLKWQISHKVVDGFQFEFDGKGSDLFKHRLLWTLLTIVTFGIYGLWVPCKTLQWETEHTHVKKLMS